MRKRLNGCQAPRTEYRPFVLVNPFPDHSPQLRCVQLAGPIGLSDLLIGTVPHLSRLVHARCLTAFDGSLLQTVQSDPWADMAVAARRIEYTAYVPPSASTVKPPPDRVAVKGGFQPHAAASRHSVLAGAASTEATAIQNGEPAEGLLTWLRERHSMQRHPIIP